MKNTDTESSAVQPCLVESASTGTYQSRLRKKMLTDLKLRKLKYKPLASKGDKGAGKLLGNRYPDKDGMYVYVSPSGTIYWGRSFESTRK